MALETFEFRVCQNPECGLRFPAARSNSFGGRCPVCLGRTVVVAARAMDREGDGTTTHSLKADCARLVVDNVRSALNVGSILRTAEGYGFAHIYLCGITPTPEHPEVKKTALGAEDAVTWSTHKNAVELAVSLRREGMPIWALERTPMSKAIEKVVREAKQGANLALVIGNEQAGVDPGILELADEVVQLDMQGRKRSFNVAVAFAIAAHELSMKRN